MGTGRSKSCRNEKKRAYGRWYHILASFSGEFGHFLPTLAKDQRLWTYMHIPQVDHIKALVLHKEACLPSALGMWGYLSRQKKKIFISCKNVLKLKSHWWEVFYCLRDVKIEVMRFSLPEAGPRGGGG